MKRKYNKGWENLVRKPSLGDIVEPTHPKVFGVKLPRSAAEKMLELPTKERTLLIRRGIMNELEKLYNKERECPQD